MLPRPSRLLGRTPGRTLELVASLGFVGSLALRLGIARRTLLVLGGIVVSALLLVVLVLGAGGR